MKVIDQLLKMTLVSQTGMISQDAFYESMMTHLAKLCVPHDNAHFSLEEFLGKQLPVIQFKKSNQHFSNFISVALLCPSKKNAWKFFYEMLSKWLVPGKLVNFSFSCSCECFFNEHPNKKLLLGEVQIALNREWEDDRIIKSLEVLIPEIKLGIQSTYQANRILEMRGVSGSEKISLIQDQMTHLIERKPESFDYDIFTLMQHFFVVSKEEFKTIRECMHLVRIIATIYLFRQHLAQKLELDRTKRHVKVKLRRARLHLPLGVKNVLCVFVSLNFLKEHEIFEKRHLLKAIQSYIPHVRSVEESYFQIEDPDEPIHTLYLEVEKEDKSIFSIDELKLLNQELSGNLRGRIEHLLRPVFMPRNEEEVMRNIILLSHQLKYLKDYPQVIISFDEQTDKEISFTVILVRVQDEQAADHEHLLKMIKPAYSIVLERERKVGYIRNKCPKQACVIRFRLPSLPFLRDDDSVDLYAARKEVLSEIQKVFGEVRDFNGGMISKQSEMFLALRKHLGAVGVQHRLLLENFFHSIYPIESRSIIKPDPLKALFLMLLKVMDSSKPSGHKKYHILHGSEQNCELALIEFFDLSVKQRVLDAVNQLQIYSRQLLQLHLKAFDGVYIGFIYFYEEEENRQKFLKALLSCY